MGYGYDLQAFLYASQSTKLSTDEQSKRIKYADLLAQTRNAITREAPELIRDALTTHEGQQKVRVQITRYLQKQRAVVDGADTSTLGTLVDQLYDDMLGFGILTAPLYDDEVQEINGNRWDDIEIVTAKGYKKLSAKFSSPQQAQDIVKRMAQLGRVTVDNARPTGDSYIFEGVRIHLKVPPIIDEAAGVQFSIRKQRREIFTADELVGLGTASREEIYLLCLCLKCGVSIGVAGNAGSGKTTDISCLLSMVPTHLRVYTIEDSRELQLERKDGRGGYLSRVMHTKTRHDANPAMNIDARQLVRDALRCDPDIIVPSEMRGAEALDVKEAGRTGHTIISSFHAQDASDAYERIASMAMMAGAGYSENTLLKYAYGAFPIMLFKMRLQDGSRKYIEIVEARKKARGEYDLVTLYKFFPTGHDKNGKILGEHRRVNPISENLAYRMRLFGASENELLPFIES